MNILPKFSYLFQSLPVFIPKSFFITLDSIISTYIWKGKQSRVAKMHLQKPKIEGGLALPNFRFYYWVANIRSLTYWLQSGEGVGPTSWLAMELDSTQGICLASFLGSSLPLSIDNFTSNPIIRHSLRVWAQLRRHFNLNNFSLQSPIVSNHLFLPQLWTTCSRSGLEQALFALKISLYTIN